jgi:hypothetical protein
VDALVRKKSLSLLGIEPSSIGHQLRTLVTSNIKPLSYKTPWPESASELYRSSDRRFSVKLVPTFADSGVSHGQRDGSLRPYSRISRPEPLLFLLSSSTIVLTWLS